MSYLKLIISLLFITHIIAKTIDVMYNPRYNKQLYNSLN